MSLLRIVRRALTLCVGMTNRNVCTGAVYWREVSPHEHDTRIIERYSIVERADRISTGCREHSLCFAVRT